MNRKLFGERLRELRAGRSREAVSELCGLHRDAIRRYEKGDATPDVDTLIAIADFFGVSIDHLVGRETKHFL